MKQFSESAVSPVVGVMLMLVVTIIIAAVVSGFAGGLIGANNQKAPTLSMDVKIINNGGWAGSGLYATVRAVSKPIQTSDLKIITSWTAENGGAPVSGGNTTLPGVVNTFAFNNGNFGGAASVNLFAPFGGGPGLNGSYTVGYQDANSETFSKADQQFGNYSLVSGTTVTAPAAGAAAGQIIGGTWNVNPKTGAASSAGANPSASSGYGVNGLYSYTPGPMLDPVTAVLGGNWNLLRAGDKVNVKIIYIPNGQVIFNQDVMVTEG
jgi:FlaG/FlaF family flagellin (archaellin)